MSCHLCVAIGKREYIHEGYSSVAIHDAFPVRLGHLLVVPLRHVGYLRDLTDDEHADLWRTVLKALLLGGDDHTVGVNDGPAAGQTVPHVHVHLIPRKQGDVPDPRGGVRWVIPDRADYWSNQCRLLE